jgi:ligand-binding sensor domain-containing protein
VIPVLLVLFAWTLVVPSLASAQDGPTPVRAFRSFTRESSTGSLPQSTVIALHEDAEGTVWIATLGGVAVVERGLVERLRPLPDAPLNGVFNTFARRRLGGVHVAGTGGLWSWDGARWERTPTPAPLISVVEARDGRLIGITTTGRLMSRSVETHVWVDVPRAPANGYETLAAGPDGAVVVGGELGVFEIVDDAIGRMICNGSPPTRVRRLHVDVRGTVWAGGDDGFVYHCRSQRGPADGWTAISIDGWQGGRIRSMTEDRHGRLWVGGDNGNVAFGSDTTPFTRWSSTNGVKGATVTALQADRT